MVCHFPASSHLAWFGLDHLNHAACHGDRNTLIGSQTHQCSTGFPKSGPQSPGPQAGRRFNNKEGRVSSQ
jgi:hypothetical protein